MFEQSEKDECLDVTIYHAFGLVVLYALYAIISGNFQTILKLTCGTKSPDAVTSAMVTETSLNVLVEPPAEDVRKLEMSDAGRVADLLAEMMGPQEESYADLSQSHLNAQSRTVKSMALRRSVRIQRSVKYHPKSARDGINEDSMNPIDWSNRKSTFIQNEPMYTWRSSAVHLPCLDDDDYEGQVNIVTTPFYKGRCSKFCGIKNVHNTMTLAPKSVSAYLYYRESICGISYWSLRYYTVDNLGFHSRKAKTSPVRGPHVALTDISDVISIDITNKEAGFFLLLKKGGEKVEFCAPSEDIMTTLITRLNSQLEIIRQKTVYEREEFVRTSRYVTLGIVRRVFH